MRRVLLVGPPGSGKISAARRMRQELPEQRRLIKLGIEQAWIYYGAGLLEAGSSTYRDPSRDRGIEIGTEPFIPFRAPHHTVSEAGLVGGGPSRFRPGEASLAHGGVLLLDELPEFRRSAIERLGMVLAGGDVAVWSTTKGSWFRVPARPRLLVATACACPCGYRGDGTGRCECDEGKLARWNERLFGMCAALGIDEVIPTGGES